MDSGQVVAAILGSGLMGSIGGGAISGWFNRRKTDAQATQLSADATRIITDAAAEVVKTLNGENVRLQQVVSRLERRVERLDRQHDADRHAQQLHSAWDYLAVRHLREQGIDLPDPPPLYAPDIPKPEDS